MDTLVIVERRKRVVGRNEGRWRETDRRASMLLSR
jgi:hypothetical protein